MQTEAELVGAAQSVTGSLQRSRQVMLEQIDNTQSILASMDASHEQLSKVTKEYQGQSDVFGTSKRLLRTLKRHSSWDKLVLYGGAMMFLLVCLYVIQKRSLYFVPTFVKTGLGKLVPTWSRSSAKDIDHLTQPIKGEQQLKGRILADFGCTAASFVMCTAITFFAANCISLTRGFVENLTWL